MWKLGRFQILMGKESVHCPSCNSSKLRRTHRIGVVERTLAKIFDLHPYRCKECDDRFFRIKTHREQPQTMPSDTQHALRR